MTRGPGFWPASWRLTSMAVMCGLWLGCASTKTADWTARIGACTFDEAVVELGPPDRSTELSDGTRVAEWVTRRRSQGSVGFGVGGGSYGRGYGRSTGVGVSTPVGDSEDILRLTFDAEGTLNQAKEVRR